MSTVIIIGQPKVLSGALEKIGFQRLLFECTPSFCLREWVGIDSHTPIYFRVDRLFTIEEPVLVKHPLIPSIPDVIRGFATTLQRT